MSSFQQSRRSPRDYFNWRKKRSAPAVEKVASALNLKNASVLEVGCGFGSLSSLLLSRGAQVVATEIDQKKLTLAKKFLRQSMLKKKIKLVPVTGEVLPFPKQTFDAVIIFDVIEHVTNPGKMMKEAQRVLKPGGILYVEFTPYYSITGHHLYDYTWLPIHLFLSKSLIKKIIFSKQTKGILTQTDLWEQFRSLNKLKIAQFQQMVSKLATIEERFIIKYPDVLEINLPLLNYLPHKDFLTLSFEGMYRKKLSRKKF